MKYSNIILILSLMFLVAGCNAIAQGNNAVNEQVIFKSNENSFTGFCVMTSTSGISDKNGFAESDDEFLMLDELFSKPISCNNDNDCYEFLLDHGDYRSMAPEFEPYLKCESKSITEINFKNN
jgi:hypothetical protein